MGTRPSDISSKSGDSALIPPNPKTLTEVLQQDINYTDSDDKNQRAKSIVVENGTVIVQGIKLKNTRFDIPITINSRVEYWVDYFTGRGRGFFAKYLERSEYFIPYIVPLLKENGLPEDLVYLAMIESGFNNLARSRAKAVGPWQFISATGRRYGLMVNGWVDERRDIRKSTLAAVGYLRDLYNMFQAWELAAASYNAGEAKVARAIRRFGTRDFWVLSKQRFLKPETRDYVPKIIAAALIAKNRVQFGFPESRILAHPGEAIAGDGEIVQVVKTDKPAEDAEDRNERVADLTNVKSELNNDDDSIPDETELNSGVEHEMGLLTSVKNGGAPKLNDQTQIQAITQTTQPLAKPVPTPHLTKSGEVGGEELAEFDVRSPADLLKIAKAAGLSYHTVKSLNPEILRWCTPPTVGSYRIRLPSSAKERFLATYNHEAFPRQIQFMTYKVRRGENLTRIARHFGIKVDLMADLNGVSPRSPLRSGSKVLLPIPNDRTRTFASLDVIDPPEKRRYRRHRHPKNSVRKINYKRSAARAVVEGRS